MYKLQVIIPSEEDIYLRKKCTYNKDGLLIINISYTLGILIWTILVCSLNLYKFDIICTLLIFLPYIIFILGMINANKITKDTEKKFFSYNYLSAGLLIFIPFLTWLGASGKKKNARFIILIVLAVIFTMLSMIDFFVEPRFLPITKHIKSIFQTLSMVLLIYAIYLYYVSSFVIKK